LQFLFSEIHNSCRKQIKNFHLLQILQNHKNIKILTKGVFLERTENDGLHYAQCNTVILIDAQGVGSYEVI